MADKTGTDNDEDLLGTSTSDRLWALAGNDRLYASDGDDELWGGDGNDLLEGGAGADTMYGGAGDDTYRVDSTADVVSEESTPGIDDGGIDRVSSSITYTLGRFLEKLTLSGTAPIDGTGNELGNLMIGNVAANTLVGLGGNDELRGEAGDDWLIGGAGKDKLTGGTGADIFELAPADAAGVDSVLDFTAEDWVGITLTDFGLAVGQGLVDNGDGTFALEADYFATGTNGTAWDHGQFVYNTTTRTLKWDADGAGAGAGVSLATFNSGTVLSASDFLIAPPVVGDISISDVTITEGNSGTKTAIFTVSRTGTAAFSVDWATASGTATAGVDFDASPTTLSFAGGQTSQTISVTITGDTSVETDETFFVTLSNATNGGTIADGQGIGIIANDDVGAAVVAIRDTTAIGSPDPSGLAYVNGTLFLCDSEVNEAPFGSSINLFALQTDGSLMASYDLTGFTIEPTGLAYDAANDILYISDDDANRIYWVDPDAPNVRLGEFRAALSGPNDAEDVAFDPATGHLFISNGTYANIREVTTTGALIQTISLPSEIRDPEALVWDPAHNVFFVGGRFSSNIWVLDRTGTIIETIDILADYPHAGSGRVRVTDLELAPSSDPNDDPGMLNLYVADYGADNVNDGRLFEIDLGNALWA
ncbi:MAG TPA: Calx-beta domain-containing protein [Ilumatobacter sp.]